MDSILVLFFWYATLIHDPITQVQSSQPFDTLDGDLVPTVPGRVVPPWELAGIMGILIWGYHGILFHDHGREPYRCS